MCPVISLVTGYPGLSICTPVTAVSLTTTKPSSETSPSHRTNHNVSPHDLIQQHSNHGSSSTSPGVNVGGLSHHNGSVAYHQHSPVAHHHQLHHHHHHTNGGVTAMVLPTTSSGCATPPSSNMAAVNMTTIASSVGGENLTRKAIINTKVSSPSLVLRCQQQHHQPVHVPTSSTTTTLANLHEQPLKSTYQKRWHSDTKELAVELRSSSSGDLSALAKQYQALHAKCFASLLQ